MNGVWENLCLQFVHDFLGFEKVEEESNLWQLSDPQREAEARSARR